MPIAKTLNQNFFKEWNPTMAYVLGFFAADGSMLTNNRGAHFIEFTIVDKVVLIGIRKAVGSNHTIAVRNRGDEKWKTQYRLQIGSHEWFADLARLGFTQNKSNTMKLPHIPQACFAHFVRGYFDGDGCVYFKQHAIKGRKKKKWIFKSLFTSGSEDFLVSLHKILHRHGLTKGFILQKHNKRGYELVFSHRDSLALYGLMYHTALTTGLYLPRKYRLFTKAIKTLYQMRA